MQRIKNSKLSQKEEVWKNLCGLIYALQISGIDLTNRKRSIYCKLLLYVYPILMHFNFIYMVVNYNLIVWYSLSMFFEVSTASLLNVALWYLIKSKVPCLLRTVLKINLMRRRNLCLKETKYKLINFILILLFLLVVIAIGLGTYYIEFGLLVQKQLVTFNTDFSSRPLKIMSRIFLFTIYYMNIYHFLAIITIFCSVLYYNFSSLIFRFNGTLKSAAESGYSSLKITHIFHRLLRLLELATELEEILSPVAILLFSLYSGIIFSFVISIVSVGLQKVDVPFLLELSVGILVSVLGIISVTLSASLIEKRFVEVKWSLMRIHEYYVYYYPNKNFALDLLRHMASMDVPAMTAWNVVKLTPAAIFSCLGSSLTLGLLGAQLFG